MIATAMHYGRNSDGSVSYQYGIKGEEATSEIFKGSYNTFLGQSCDMHVINSTAVNQSANIVMTRFNGNRPLGNGMGIVIPANGTRTIDICSLDAADGYGVVEIEAESKGALRASIVRNAPGDAYRFSTPIR